MSLELESRSPGIETHLEPRAPEAALLLEQTAVRTRDVLEIVHARPLLDPRAPRWRESAAAVDRVFDAATMRSYAAPSQLWDWRQLASLLLGELAGKELLDYGCGTGEQAVYFARLGACVSAIDISEPGIEILRRRAAHHELDIRACEMRCDQTSFPDDSFDRVHGVGILHRVGIDAALAEVWRVLRPGGVAVFYEPVGESPVIEVMKRFAPRRASSRAGLGDRSEPEPDLTWEELRRATTRFARATTYPYHLLYRLKRFVPGSLREVVRRFDHGVLAMAPSLRRYAGGVVMHLVK